MSVPFVNNNYNSKVFSNSFFGAEIYLRTAPPDDCTIVQHLELKMNRLPQCELQEILDLEGVSRASGQ